MSNWHSGIGKHSLLNLRCLFEAEPFNLDPDVIKSYVKEGLTDNAFVYCDQEVWHCSLISCIIADHLLRGKNLKGSFQSDLILGLFSIHLKTSLKTEVSYGKPLGALALCAAAV
jgi:hypothetical protein